MRITKENAEEIHKMVKDVNAFENVDREMREAIKKKEKEDSEPKE